MISKKEISRRVNHELMEVIVPKERGHVRKEGHDLKVITVLRMNEVRGRKEVHVQKEVHDRREARDLKGDQDQKVIIVRTGVRVRKEGQGPKETTVHNNPGVHARKEDHDPKVKIVPNNQEDHDQKEDRDLKVISARHNPISGVKMAISKTDLTDRTDRKGRIEIRTEITGIAIAVPDQKVIVRVVTDLHLQLIQNHDIRPDYYRFRTGWICGSHTCSAARYENSDH